MESFLVSVRNALRQRKLVAEQLRLQSELERRNAELRQRVGQLEEAFNLLASSPKSSPRISSGRNWCNAPCCRNACRISDRSPSTPITAPAQRGRDLYDVVRVDNDHAAFYVADAAGHGVSAAMVAVLSNCGCAFTTRERSGSAADRVLTEVNRAILLECSTPGLFLTAPCAS